MQVSYKNWRGMQDSGGRRIKRALHIDKTSIDFCNNNMLTKFGKINLVSKYVERRQAKINEYDRQHKNSNFPLDGPQVTNVEIYRIYIQEYLNNHPEIHTKKMDFLVRELAPGPTGLPIEVYAFTKTTKWVEYERIQAEVFDHLLAATKYFDLRLFQEPSGSDFAAALSR